MKGECMIQQNIFEALKQSVTPWQAASFYGLKTNRNRMCRCPFHNDRHPSLKLYDDHFYCFGCGRTGDVTALTAGILGISQIDAAGKLCEDFGLRPDAGLYEHCSRHDPGSLNETESSSRSDTGCKPDQGQTPGEVPAIPAHIFDVSVKEQRAFFSRLLLRYRELTKEQMKDLSPAAADGAWSDAFIRAAAHHSRAGIMLDILLYGADEDVADLLSQSRYELEGIYQAVDRFSSFSC